MGDYGMVEQSSIERAINRAIASLTAKGVRRHQHGRQCMNILRHVLYADEVTILEARQSGFVSLAPTRIVATKKRLIIVDPSFWGLHTGRDISDSTEYTIIPYRYVISVTISKGLFFSSITIHTSSGSDNNAKGASEIHGIDHLSALNMATFIEEIIEFEGAEEETEKGAASRRRQEDAPIYSRPNMTEGISLEEARPLVLKGARFLWTGVEPIEDVARLLGTEKANIIAMSGSHLLKLTKVELEKMPQLVIISYDGIMAVHTANQLKKKFGVEAKVLRGGIMAVAASLKDQASEFLK
jgi:hypothetical protein